MAVNFKTLFLFALVLFSSINVTYSNIDVSWDLVSVAYDPYTIDYSDENAVYSLVTRAIQQLNPSDPENPLSNIITEGDVVILKPNLVSLKGLDREECTRVQVIRPVIELAVKAGASKIVITEGPAYPNWEDEVFYESGVVDLVSELDIKHPGTIISYQNVNIDEWTWIDLNQYSMLSGEYHAEELYGYGELRMDNNSYYYAEDSKGYDPKGYTPGLYAIANTILGADVFINIPKMKVHQINGITMSMKNLIGIYLIGIPITHIE
jgi:hypothetical protein